METTAASMTQILSKNGLPAIRDAALRAVNTAGRLARFESYNAVAVQLGFGYSEYFNVSRSSFSRDPAGYADYQRRRDERKLYEGRVDRALLALAAAGEIRRVKLGDEGPDGHRARDAAYWSSVAWYQAVSEAGRAAAAEAELRAAWQEISEELASRFGVDSSGPSWRAPQLDLEDWQRILRATERNEIE
jgi:hypothetical protein